jgi:hypothetical protein
MARKTLCNVLVLLTFGLATTGTLLGCDRTSFSATGVNQPMKTYYIGRFSVDIPEGKIWKSLPASSSSTLARSQNYRNHLDNPTAWTAPRPARWNGTGFWKTSQGI